MKWIAWWLLLQLLLARSIEGAPVPQQSSATALPPVRIQELNSIPIVTPAIELQALSEITVPVEFNATVFATPPVVSHPAALAATADGTVFVGVDGNGTRSSLPSVGRILRLRDNDKDGKVDEVKAFVPNVASVRGMVWDHDRLIVMHAPTISAYRDTDGDGTADEEQILIRGMGSQLGQARVNHGQNGLALGIDGWVYLALGDQGVDNAIGADGRKLRYQGGGVVRLRPDGTGLELWATGTRNIYGIVVTPLLDAFARDNSNDGRGWNIRLEHFSGFTEHGYPSLFKNFPGEYLPPMAEYVGGSGTGAFWLEEPAIPRRWNNAIYTADYARLGIFHEDLKEKGATFSLTSEPFITVPNVMTADVDANGVLYVATWRGGSSAWEGPTTGMVYRIAPKGHAGRPVPRFDKLPAAELVSLFESESYRCRLAAQRALLRHGSEGKQIEPLLAALAGNAVKSIPTRITALFTLKLMGLDAKNETVAKLIRDPALSAWALRAAGEFAGSRTLPIDAIEDALKSSQPRVRKEAVIAMTRIEANSNALTPLMADSDPIVAHTAVQALKRKRAIGDCLRVIDSASSSPIVRAGALRVLQALHEPAVADALIKRLGQTRDRGRRLELISALARLAHIEGEWNGEWWGAHVDNTGPYFRPVTWTESSKISEALKNALDQAEPGDVIAIGRELQRQGVDAGPAVKRYIGFAESEPTLIPQITAYFATADEVLPEGIPLLTKVALSAKSSLELRAQAVLALAKTDGEEAWRALLVALAALQEPVAGASEVPGLTVAHRMALQQAEDAQSLKQAAVVSARAKLLATCYDTSQDAARIKMDADALIQSDLTLARSWALEMEKRQRSISPLSAAQVQELAREMGAAPWGRRPARRTGRIAGLTPASQQALRSMDRSLEPLAEAARGARIALFTAAYSGSEHSKQRAQALQEAEERLASARAQSFARIQSSPARLGAEALKGVVAQTVAPSGMLVARAPDEARSRALAKLAGQARDSVFNSGRLDRFSPLLVRTAREANGEEALVADGLLLSLATRKSGPTQPREAARAALDEGWRQPERRLQIIVAAVRARQTGRASDIVAATNDPDYMIAQTARFAVRELDLASSTSTANDTSPLVGTLSVPVVLALVTKTRGDARRGAELVGLLGCLACHTVDPAETPKGPALSAVAFPRRELAEAIIRPNKEIAHGFATNRIKLRDGTEVDGFVVRQAGELLTVRNLAAEEKKIAIRDIARRETLETSLMPEGLLNSSTVHDFASLLDYLESLSKR